MTENRQEQTSGVEVAVERELAVYDRWKKGSPTGTKKRVCETLLKKVLRSLRK